MLPFNDPQSPFSRLWQVKILPALVRKYVETGELQIQWHGFAVLGPASVAGEDFIAAAGLQNHLWDVLDSIMVHQGEENSGWLWLPSMRKALSGQERGRLKIEDPPITLKR